MSLLACLVTGTGLVGGGTAFGPRSAAAEESKPESTVAEYFDELERVGLIDTDTGDRGTLSIELGAAEQLLRAGATIDSAVALYAIVESPRYRPFADFVEYQNAEYYLAVALASAGAYDSSLAYLERAMARGPSALYFAPAHRRAVDIAIETRTYQEVLTRLEAIKFNEPIPTGAAGERAYLRARIAYDAGQFPEAEAELVRIGKKSRLYSSALYLRGIIRVRKGEFRDAASALCEIVETPDDDKFTFVVDDRYFTIKDLARLGLGRIAHEQREYDDAYYHYFQIPDDSDRLPEALFEAGWSMYQKRELATARDLVSEMSSEFPSSPLVPEARLLAGYIELADCKFTESQQHYDKLVADLQPVVDEMERIKKDPDRRKRLFERALRDWRVNRETAKLDSVNAATKKAKNKTDQVLALLRLDPEFVRLHEAVNGLRRAAGDAPFVVRSWTGLGRQVAKTRVAAVAATRTIEEEDASDANALVEDIGRLRDDVARARDELRRGQRDETLSKEDADLERKRLGELDSEIATLQERATAASEALAAGVAADSAPGLAPMVQADLERARRLRTASEALQAKLDARANELAVKTIDKLYTDTRRVLDKAKLGKIDAVIGQKRKLDIEVLDLASGRYPPELHGRLWEEGLIGDDEEFWPFQGEYWADEYEGWR